MYVPRIIAALLVLGAGTALACNGVLGIDEATLDQASTPGPCETYCADIMTNCTGALQEYISLEVCRKMCAAFEPGIPGADQGDSRACRSYHAQAAKENPSVHCRHAGPLGGGVCGDNPCNPFCLLTVAQCGAGETAPYPGGEGPCRAECTGKFVYDQTVSDIHQADANTLNCRLYHLQSAYEPNNPQAATTHCPHAATKGVHCN